MSSKSTFVRAYAAPLIINGAFIAAIALSFNILLSSSHGSDSYGWVYPLLSALGISVGAIIVNIIMVLIMSYKNRSNLSNAYSACIALYIFILLFFYFFYGQMNVHIGKLEGG
jgi:chromate transport protein ChrA